jgi:hypothetical protein
VDLGEPGRGFVNWIRVAQDRGKWGAVALAVMNPSIKY